MEILSGERAVWSVKCEVESVRCVFWWFQTSCRPCSLNLRQFRKHAKKVACARFVVQSRAGKSLVQALQYKVVLGDAGRYFVQALQYKVVLGGTLWKLCGTGKYFWRAL